VTLESKENVEKSWKYFLEAAEKVFLFYFFLKYFG